MKLQFKYLVLLVIILGSCKTDNSTSVNGNNLKRIECVTPLGDTLFSYSMQPEKLLQSFWKAKDDYESNPEDAEAIIWFGRRVAYMGRYREAIDIFAEAIKKHPDDARMYRHRGHRYLSIREYDKAIEDFEKACVLIRGKENEIEPDGIPNDRGIPISTLHGNIYYHLALAYYLKNDLLNALRVYDLCAASNKNADNIVSTCHWKYMALRRSGYHEEAEKLLNEVKEGIDVIENISYYEACLFYKGLLKEDWFANKLSGSSKADVFSYTLGNWNLYEQKDSLKAKTYFEGLLKDGNKASFAYLAAEADYARLFSN